MEFRETLLAAQRNQQQKSSGNAYYKARFDPPKKEQKQRDRLSANIQKFLAKKEEEERRQKIEAQRKKDELQAMRDPKALRKIQKTLKVIKSANKSVIADAIDREHTAVTRDGPMQPDQDDYGYESQEAAAIYQKMMEKYSKLPEEPKFPKNGSKTKKDIGGTLERVKHALQHEDDPVPHKRRRRTEHDGVAREISPPPKVEDKKKDEKPKFRKPAPPPLDFNELLKIAEQKKSEPLEVVAKKVQSDPEPERLMTKKQKREYEEEMARRQRRQERIESAARQETKKGNVEDKHAEKEKKPEQIGFGRIPKIGDRNGASHKPDTSKQIKTESEKLKTDRAVNRETTLRENDRNRVDRDREYKEKEKQREREKLEKLNAQRKQVEKDIERLNRHREMLEKTKMKLEESTKAVDKYKMKQQEIKKNIDLKSQNTYRIDKNGNSKPGVSSVKHINGNSSDKSSPKLSSRDISNNHKYVDSKQKGPTHIDKSKQIKNIDQRNTSKPKPEQNKNLPSTLNKSKPSISNSFDFDKHVNALKNNQKNDIKRPDGSRQYPPDDVRRKANDEKRKMLQKRRRLDSESDYDSEMDDFIDDGDEEIDYSTHIKEIFGYDKSKYNYVDDDDDPTMESSFTQQMREELHSKKIGIMEDLEDIRKEKEMKKKKKRRIDDD